MSIRVSVAEITVTGGNLFGGLMVTIEITNASGIPATIDIDAIDHSGRVVLYMV